MFIAFSCEYVKPSSALTIPSNNLLFNPVNMVSNYYSIYDGTSLLRSGLPPIKWDTRNRYPGISMAVSDPFLTNFDGSVIINSSDGLTNANGVKGVVYNSEDGTLKFLQTFTIAQDIAIRTHSNFPTIKYRSWVYDELVGITLGGGADLLDSNGNEPYGVLYAFRRNDKDAAEWAGTGAEFQKCLLTNTLKQDFYRSVYPYSINNDAYLAEWFGNRDCTVEPTITLNANDMDIQYDYNVGVGGQGYFSLSSKSIKVGFVNVRQSNSKREYGIVQDYNSENEDYQLELDETAPEEFQGTKTGDDTTHNEGTVQVYFRYKSGADRNEALPFEDYIFPSNYLTKSIDAQTINTEKLETFDFPQEVSYSSKVLMQPRTTIKYATFETQSYYIFKDWLGKNIGSGYITKNFELPYGMKIDNVYTIHRVMTDVIVLSEQEVLWNPVAGDPLVPSDLSSFGINEFGLLPYNVDLEIEAKIPTTIWEDLYNNWNDFWEDPFGFFSGLEVDPIVWLIVIAVIVVFVVIALLRFVQPKRRPPPTYTPAPVQQPQYYRPPPPPPQEPQVPREPYRY